MSCSSSCPCQFKWPLDTLGSKRDPINSEKAWLDFAVRLLSREVVRKGKGQETVWSARCKPQWWDQEVGLAWKNPTANPKDTKEMLLTKYTALERHLQEENRFPAELMEEAQLWNSGKHRELYLLTTLTSLLGKVTAVHSAVIDASLKVDELNAHVNQDLLDDIKSCLTSTLQATENIKSKNRVPKTLKRPNCHSGKENNVSPPVKCKKLEETPPSEPVQTLNISFDKSSEHCQQSSKEILSYLGKVIAKRKSGKVASQPVKASQKKIQPKPCVAVPTDVDLVTKAPAIATFPCLPTQSQSLADCFTLSQEQVDSLLQGGKIIFCNQPDNERDSTNAYSSNVPSVLSTIAEVDILNSSSLSPIPVPDNTSTSPTLVEAGNQYIECIHNNLYQESQSSNASEHLPFQVVSPTSDNRSQLDSCLPMPSDLSVPPFDLLEQFDFIPPPEINAQAEQETCNLLSSFSSPNPDSSTGPTNNYDSFTLSVGNEYPASTCEVIGSRISNGRIDSSGGSSGGDSEHSQTSSDAGYSSESHTIDLDKIISVEECQQLLLGEEDDSYLLDKFLDELDGNSDMCEMLNVK